MTFFPDIAIRYADSPAVDGFNRLRIANPIGLFDAQFTYNLNPLLYEPITNGSGATVTHDATNRLALMTFASTPTGGKAFMQSYDCFHYQPGKSQLIYVTFNFLSTSTNTLKFAGYSDGTNGIEFQQSGSTLQFEVLSSTSLGNETVTQSNWNLDKLNGTGASGLTLDITKVQILVIDFQALYTGRVRVGFDIGGKIIYAHEFNHANLSATPYFASANLPIRVGMTCSGTVSTTMDFICASVISEGGTDNTTGRTFSVEGSATAGNGTAVHILSLRPKTTFNSITNRILFELDSVNLAVTGNNSVRADFGIGQAITGTTTFSDVNTTYSGFEFNTAGTISGSPAITIGSVYAGPVTGSNNAVFRINNKYPITLDAAGAVRSLGTLSAIVTGLGNTSACRVSFNWREVR